MICSEDVSNALSILFQAGDGIVLHFLEARSQEFNQRLYRILNLPIPKSTRDLPHHEEPIGHLDDTAGHQSGGTSGQRDDAACRRGGIIAGHQVDAADHDDGSRSHGDDITGHQGGGTGDRQRNGRVKGRESDFNDPQSLMKKIEQHWKEIEEFFKQSPENALGKPWSVRDPRIPDLRTRKDVSTIRSNIRRYFGSLSFYDESTTKVNWPRARMIARSVDRTSTYGRGAIKQFLEITMVLEEDKQTVRNALSYGTKIRTIEEIVKFGCEKTKCEPNCGHSISGTVMVLASHYSALRDIAYDRLDDLVQLLRESKYDYIRKFGLEKEEWMAQASKYYNGKQLGEVT